MIIIIDREEWCKSKVKQLTNNDHLNNMDLEATAKIINSVFEYPSTRNSQDFLKCFKPYVMYPSDNPTNTNIR